MLRSMDGPRFQPWTHWSKREGIQRCDLPGVYVLARFESQPPDEVDPTCVEVIYIGETSRNSLSGRWYQFRRSAFELKGGHSGGWTFAARFCDNKVGPAPAWLHVAAVPVDLHEPHASAFIRFAERRLIWEYVQRHGVMPQCNRK